MKLSELIKKLEMRLKTKGDEHLRLVKLTYLEEFDEHRLLSPIRKTKTGQRAYMNQKEFENFCEDNRL